MSLLFDRKKTVISDSLSKRLAAMLSKEFGDAELDTHLTRIKEMLNRRHLITVYELGAGSDIDSAILHALLSGRCIILLIIIITIIKPLRSKARGRARLEELPAITLIPIIPLFVFSLYTGVYI